MTLNSSSALDLAIVDYFLLLQVTRFAPKKEQYPIVNLQSTIDAAQLASLWASNSSSQHHYILPPCEIHVVNAWIGLPQL